MKKLISLLVAAVLVVTCLSGVCFAADPIAKVETNGKTVEVTDISQLPAAVNANGTSVITLLKDVTHDDQVKLPVCTIDLNGHTWSTKAAQKNALYFDGRDLTAADATNLYVVVKNGTIDAGRTAISINVGALRVENATLISNSEIPAIQLLAGKNNNLIEGKWNDGNVMENCTVYCAQGPAFRYNSENKDFSKVKYTINNSTIVTESEINPVLMCKDGVTQPGAFEIGKGVSFYYNAKNAVVNTAAELVPVMSGETIQKVDGTHSVKVAGVEYKGLSMSATDGAIPVAPAPADPTTPAAPATPSVPATTVPDVTVPKTGASVIALGVMAMVSLAGAAITKKH